MSEKWLDEWAKQAIECWDGVLTPEQRRLADELVDDMKRNGLLSTPATRQAAEACEYFKRHSADMQRQVALDGVWVAGAAVEAEREARNPKPRWGIRSNMDGDFGVVGPNGIRLRVEQPWCFSDKQAAACAKALNELEG